MACIGEGHMKLDEMTEKQCFNSFVFSKQIREHS